MSTVKETRLATDEQLLAESFPRLNALIAEGVTTVEIKSGYGLSLEHERKQLQVARELANATSARHEHHHHAAGRACDSAGVRGPRRRLRRRNLPKYPAHADQAKGLVDAVDAFCENIGFTREQCKRVFNAATVQGVRVKLHAEQLSDQQGAALAAAFRALSADHLEYASDAGIVAMREAGDRGRIAAGRVLLPARDAAAAHRVAAPHGVPMALATDHNPGTSPLTSLLLVTQHGATLFRMTVDECLLGVTRQRPPALDMSKRVGTLEAGKQCDLAIWNVERPAELVYAIGANPLHERVWKGT